MTRPDLTQYLETAAEGAVHDVAELLKRLELLQQENEALGRELLRSYEQINLVFDITDNIAKMREPETIKRALLQRFGAMIGAGAMFLDHNGQFTPIELVGSLGRRLELEPQSVRDCLATEIELVRQTQRAQVPTRTESMQQRLDRAHVMVVSLRRHEAEAAVMVVLRDQAEPAFDSGDMLSSESVLDYGGQVLSNVLMVRHLQQSAVEMVRALANAIDAKDNYTRGHSERVGWLARLTGTALGLPDSELELLEWAGVLHDVGKIGISEQILNKPGKLTADEYEEMKRHPRLSYEVLKPVGRLGPVLDGVLYHHENWDGSGYPEGLRGEQIPLSARIIRIVDTFDALTSTRSYRQGFDIERAFRILREEIDRSVEPRITEVFIETFERYVREQPEDFEQRFEHARMGCSQSEGVTK